MDRNIGHNFVILAFSTKCYEYKKQIDADLRDPEIIYLLTPTAHKPYT